MWSVRIADGSAERISKIGISSLLCDCSEKGNSFCIIFQPDLARIADGDQFEVEIQGLCSTDSDSNLESTLYFFHEFRLFHAEHIDYHLVTAARDFCGALENTDLWK